MQAPLAYHDAKFRSSITPPFRVLSYIAAREYVAAMSMGGPTSPMYASLMEIYGHIT